MSHRIGAALWISIALSTSCAAPVETDRHSSSASVPWWDRGVWVADWANGQVVPGTIRRMGPAVSGKYHQPQISPDGSRVAFWGGADTATGHDVFVSNVDGTGLVNLTGDGVSSGPQWSPDSSEIVFTSRRSGSGQIWIMNADGTGSRQLTSTAGPSERPTLAPDGNTIVYTHGPPGTPWDADRNLWMTDRGGAVPVQLTSHPYLDFKAHFSPSQRYLAYHSGLQTGGGKHRLAILALPVTGPPIFPIPVASSADWHHGAFWLADDRHVLIHGSIGTQSGTFRVDAFTGQATPLPLAGFNGWGHVALDAAERRISFTGNRYAMPPTAVASASPRTGSGALLRVDFDAGGSIDVNGHIETYDWDFGDGTYGTGPVTSHTYSAAGTYTATLVVTDDQFESAQATVTVTVGASAAPASVLRWSFDDGSGTVAADDSGNGMNGILRNGPVWTSGVDGGALWFDGVDDHVSADPADWSGDYTVALWVRADAVGQVQNTSVFNTRDGSADPSSFQIDVDGANPGSYRFRSQFTETLGPVTTGWTHLAVTRSGSTARMYYDGAPVGESTLPPGTADTFFDYVVGRNRAGVRYFAGTVDDVRIYDGALSDAEVAALAQAGSTASPVLYWPLDEGTGTVASDASGSGVPGTLRNGTAWTGGVSGQALWFDGTDDHVIASPAAWSGDFTVALWVRAETTGQSGAAAVFNSGSGAAAASTFQIDVDGSSPGRFRFLSGVRGDFGPVTTGWTHLAATRSGTTLTLYYDGVAVDTVQATPGQADRITDYVLGRNRAATRYFHGTLDQVRVYDVCLRADEIASLYVAGL